MKYSYVYEIIWEYVLDDSETHRTLIEVSRPCVTSAEHRFKKFYESIHPFTLCPYEVVSVRLLGKVPKMKWN